MKNCSACEELNVTTDQIDGYRNIMVAIECEPVVSMQPVAECVRN